MSFTQALTVEFRKEVSDKGQQRRLLYLQVSVQTYGGLSCAKGGTTVMTCEDELTELREKLAAMDKYQDEIAIKWKREIKRAEAAEAEAAALRERERWIPVEEKLPEEDTRVLIAVECAADDHDGVSQHWREVHTGTVYATPLQTIASLDNDDEYEGKEIVGWKALSAAPERGKDGK